MALRIGVLGLGRIGELHARNLAGSEPVSTLVVYDTDQDRARGVGAKLGAEVAASLPELLSRGVDGVVVATPTPSHAELVTAALQHDVPVFCEKPLAASVDCGLRVAALADERRVPLQVGLQRRCDPALGHMRQHLQSGVDGRLLGLRIVSSSWRPPPPDYLAGSGGFFRDKLVHDVDVVRWVTGRAIEAAAVMGSGTATGWIGAAGDVDTVSVSLRLEGGVVAQIWSARLSPTRFEFRVDAISERRAMSAGRWLEGDTSDATRRESPFATFLGRFEEAYSQEMVSFCRLAAGAPENACTAWDAMASELAADALERAWREGRVVQAGELAARETEATRISADRGDSPGVPRRQAP